MARPYDLDISHRMSSDGDFANMSGFNTARAQRAPDFGTRDSVGTASKNFWSERITKEMEIDRSEMMSVDQSHRIDNGSFLGGTNSFIQNV